MNLFLRIFSPRLPKAIERLGRTIGLNYPANHHTNHYHPTIMSSLTAAEEVAIIETAIGVIVNQKQALADAVQALTPLSNENLELRDIIRAMEAEDKTSDDALTRLRDLLPQGEAPETPVTDPVTEPVAGGEVTQDIPTGVDPVDPPAAPSDLDGPTA